MSFAVKVNSSDDIKELLRKSLSEKYFDAVLGLYWNKSGDTVSLNIASDPAHLDKLEILCPVMPVQAARVISNVKFTDTNLKIACVVKPCEMRAVVELIKLKQIMPEKLFFISMDCGGAIDPVEFKDKTDTGKNPVNELKEALAEFKDYSDLAGAPRAACMMCDKFIPKLCDLRLRDFGKDICIEPLTDKGKAFCDWTNLSGEDRNFTIYDSKIAMILDKRMENKHQERNKFKEKVNSIEGFTKELSACIRCHNCMVNCPADYCKECIFRTPVFDHPSENYELWLGRKGSVRLPSDTLLFHLTRLNHMSTSCVSCGLCESSCPVSIKLTRIFSFIGEETQKMFDYEAGRALDEELPVATFREKELDKI